MEPIWNWGNDVIVAIQTFHTPMLDSLFNGITFTGEAEFFLLIFPFIIWTVNKTVGYRLTYLVMISIAVNNWAKLIIDHPRPYEWPSADTSPILKLNHRADGPGLPSGHAQNSLTLWFYLAYRFKWSWLWWTATALFILVSFSRVYLGVHFPTDLLGGAVLGVIVLVLFLTFEPVLTSMILAQSRGVRIALAVTIPFIIILLHPHPITVVTMGLLGGFSLGIIFERDIVGFQATGSILERVTRFVIGIVLLALIFKGLGLVVPASDSIWHVPLTIVRYAVSGFWASGGAPWLFQRMTKYRSV